MQKLHVKTWFFVTFVFYLQTLDMELQRRKQYHTSFDGIRQFSCKVLGKGLLKAVPFLTVLILCFLSACSDEPERADDQLVRKRLLQVVEQFDSDVFFNAPANPPEYVIINSARDMTDLPDGMLDETMEQVCSKVDFADNTIIVVTSVIYCEPNMDEDKHWNWALADYDFKKGYKLDIRYRYSSVLPTSVYTQKSKIQFGFTTQKIPSDTKITITESMSND